MRGLAAWVLVSATLGCEPGRPAESPPVPAPTEADACARLCTRLEACEIAPPTCEAKCTRDQARLRKGVQPGFATCLEARLGMCETRGIPDRRQVVSLCWTATLEAWEREVGQEAIAGVVRAVCTQAARCEPSAAPVDECLGTLGKRMASSPQGKTLAVARPELVSALAACVSNASCTEPHPVAACAELQEKDAP